MQADGFKVQQKLTVMAAIIGLAITAAAPPAFAQIEIEVNTLKDSYVAGEAVVIFGSVSTLLDDTPIILKIEMNRMTIEAAQLTVARDRGFTHTVIADGPQWKRDGQYEVIATYGIADSATARFAFTAAASEVSDVIDVDNGDGDSFSMKYVGTGVTIQDARIVQSDFALTANVISEDGGRIVFELPRSAIDAKTNGCEGSDEDFIVLVNGIVVAYDMVEDNPGRRSVGIDVDGGGEVQIIGTCVIPEFGAVAAIILAAAIMGVVALRGIKTRILP